MAELQHPIEQDGEYVLPTDAVVTIPAGSLVIHQGDLIQTQVGPVVAGGDGEDGDVVFWQNPPERTEGLHPAQVEDYEPHFDRQSLHRRVLMHVTDETDNFKLGPRNTITAIADALSRDPYTAQVNPRKHSGEQAERITERALDALIAAGLVEQRDDESFVVTDAGRTELAN